MSAGCPIHFHSRTDRYYEWQKKGKDKIPYFAKHKDDKLMLFAGLYDCVVLEGEKDPLWTFTIVTTMANSDFDWLHDRQPVILTSQQAIDTWLDTSSHTWTDELTKLVEPYHDQSSPLEW
jgi:putative SOS response-associated peptidase YedK